jgi:NADH-quinone oxidoreductase subunit F
MDRDATLILHDCPEGHSISLAEYRERGGYQALERVLKNLQPGEVIKTVLDSGLRGLGGAGFSTGRKWSLVKEESPFPRYIIANTDEMEPGTYKDRVLVYQNPHALIEGLLIAGFAVSAQKGIVFIRPAYEGSAQVLDRAVGEAREAGLLGSNILGSSYSLDLAVHRSAGRYICGETKGLVHALEGKRPHPNLEGHLTSEGLWGRPTVIDNAESLAYVPSILRNGAVWFRGLGRNPDAPGRKIYSLSGRVVRPGCYELPFGTPLSEIIEEHGGGMLPGYTFKTCLPGGASTRFLPKAHYHVGMDFESFSHIGKGHRFGTGAIMVFDQTTCLVGVALNLIRFFARESCGFCTPCREGIPYIRDLLERIENGEGEEAFIPLLEHLARQLSFAYCAFAPGAATPVLSLLEDYAEEIHEHIVKRRCPYENNRCMA